VKSEREPLAVLKKHMGEDRESVPFSWRSGSREAWSGRCGPGRGFCRVQKEKAKGQFQGLSAFQSLLPSLCLQPLPGFCPQDQKAAKPPERPCVTTTYIDRLLGGPSYSRSLAHGRLILLSKLYKILILQSGNLGEKKKPAMGKCWLCSTRHSVLRGSIIKTLIQLFLFKWTPEEGPQWF
jgi:hypothetical protein